MDLCGPVTHLRIHIGVEKPEGYIDPLDPVSYTHLEFEEVRMIVPVDETNLLQAATIHSISWKESHRAFVLLIS